MAAEIDRFSEAALAVQKYLQQQAEQAQGESADILSALAMIAADSTLKKETVKLIQAEQAKAEWAVWQAGARLAQLLESLGGYQAARGADVKDIAARIAAVLQNKSMGGVPESDEPFILGAADLSAADTAGLDPQKVAGIITQEGSSQSHTAIIARALGIPAVVSASQLFELTDATAVCLDGDTGQVIINPTQAQLAEVNLWRQAVVALEPFDGEGRLGSGERIELLANIGSCADALQAAEYKAEGVGLFRTEFLFLAQEKEPTVQEQSERYAEIFSVFAGKKVVVRTLDAGSDKPLKFISTPAEPNPALGVRGYRTRKAYPEVLSNQLKALGLAAQSSEAEVWVMPPMITLPKEAEEFRALAAECGLRMIGSMIEVPAAAVGADLLSPQVDFLSIGSNDLVQYACAADRMLGELEYLMQPWQPAVLRLIAMTIAGAAGKPVGVCGEAAAVPEMAVILAGLGVSSLSMSARALPLVSKMLRSVTLEKARKTAEYALANPGCSREQIAEFIAA